MDKWVDSTASILSKFEKNKKLLEEKNSDWIEWNEAIKEERKEENRVKKLCKKLDDLYLGVDIKQRRIFEPI